LARIFISYSHKDDALRAELDKHLALLRREGAVELWSDHRILPGSEFDKEISQALEAAEIILLLVSADFLASDYCFGIEMRRALERHDSAEAVVVPVILRACDWQHSPFKHLNALPSGGREIAKWASPDDAFLNVVQGLRKLLAARPTSVNVLAAAVGRTAAAREAGELSKVRSARRGASRSSNLALPTEFSDEAKHEFAEQTFAYVKDYFRGSLDELQRRNPGYSGKLRDKSAVAFTAVVFKNGQRVAGCYIRLGGMMSSNGIAYSGNENSSDNSYNEILDIQTDKHSLLWRAQMGAFSGRDPAKGLSQEGAAEHLWSMLIAPLQ
jgi:TIR domain